MWSVESEFAGTAASVLSAFIALGALWLSIRQYSRSRQDLARLGREETLESRLDELTATMRQSAKLIAQVEQELQARAATAERLKGEAATAESLMKLAENEREAVARLVRAEISAESRKSFRSGLRLNFLFFVAGALASVATTLFIQPLG